MSHSLHIGGVSFSVVAPEGVEILPSDPLYGSFRHSSTARPEVSTVPVVVHIDYGAPECLAGQPILFDTDQSWFAQRDGEDLVLILRGSGDPGELLWSARLSGDRTRVDLRCGERFWTSGATPRLHDPMAYPLDQLLTMMVLAHGRRGTILHAAGVVRGRRAIAFVGISGAGKSTLVNLLRGDMTAVSDDRVVVRVTATDTVLFGTPWAGEARAAEAESAPLSALTFLQQASITEVRPLARADALYRLLPALSVPWFDEPAACDVLGAAEKVLERVPTFELLFQPDSAVREVIEDLF